MTDDLDNDPIWRRACQLQRRNKQMRAVYLAMTVVNIAIGIIFDHWLSWVIAIVMVGVGVFNEWLIGATHEAMIRYSRFGRDEGGDL